MRIACVGGGPGGLFFATLIKRRCPQAEVAVFERNRPDDTFGFGVVFSDATLDVIGAADPDLAERMREVGRYWDTIEVWMSGQIERCGGMGTAAVVRKTLLHLLQESAIEAGVDLRFETTVSSPAELADYDLVVVADGSNSLLRDSFAKDFGPSTDTATAKFVWFGTTYMFEGLTFVYNQSEHGAFAVHGYPIDDEKSTFIVEADPETWKAAGLDEFDVSRPPGESDAKTQRYLTELFADQIGGAPLLENNSRWGNFRSRRANSWSRHDARTSWVLLGDAAHTAHFSVGSGTKMAMEDAIVLADKVAGADLRTALAEYESERRPKVERIQSLGRPSLLWWEHFGRYMDSFEPTQFAFHFLTRSISREKLAKRDAGFVARADADWQARHGHAPLETPLYTQAGSIPGRLLGTADGIAGCAWLTAPETEEGLPAAYRELAAHAADGPVVLGIRGGSRLTRLILSEEARLRHHLLVLVQGDYTQDEARTMIQSGRTDLVVTPGTASR